MHLVKNPDIAKAVGQVKEHRKLIIFSAETQNLFTYAKDKLADKNADMVVANDVTEKGAGFDVDTNVVTLIKRNGMRKCYPVLSKSKVAGIILDEALK